MFRGMWWWCRHRMSFHVTLLRLRVFPLIVIIVITSELFFDISELFQFKKYVYKSATLHHPQRKFYQSAKACIFCT